MKPRQKVYKFLNQKGDILEHCLLPFLFISLIAIFYFTEPFSLKHILLSALDIFFIIIYFIVIYYYDFIYHEEVDMWRYEKDIAINLLKKISNDNEHENHKYILNLIKKIDSMNDIKEIKDITKLIQFYTLDKALMKDE